MLQGHALAMSLAFLLALVGSVPALAQPAATKPPTTVSFANGISGAADVLMDRFRAGESPAKLEPEAAALVDLCVAFAQPSRDGPAIVRVAVVHRLLSTISELKKQPEGLTAMLADNPVLSRELALAWSPEDKPEHVYPLLAHLAKQRPELIGDTSKLSALVAAICLVYDDPPPHPTLAKLPVPIQDTSNAGARPLVMPAAPVIDPVVVLDHFAKSRGRMVHSLETMPVALLVHVVDVHTTVQDRAWALANHAGNRTPGMLYDTVTYDTAHFKYNQPKKIFREKAYSLENLKRVGGVCVEQAFFSSEVGKAIGVPSVFVTTRGATVGHAYVGYLKPQGNSVVWDFDEGRHEEYEELRGNIIHPQTGKRVDTGAVTLTGPFSIDKPEERSLAAALTLLAARAGSLAGGSNEYPPAPPESIRHACNGKFRPATAQTQMDLLRAALAASPSFEPAWQIAGSMAQSGQLSSSQRGEWCKAAISMCARTAPDFAFTILNAMITSASPEEQERQWEWASRQFVSRPDLLAACFLNTAAAWEQADNNAKAWAAYQTVIRRFPNDGTVIVDALARSEALLGDKAKPQVVLDLYLDAFRRIRKPSKTSTEFMTVSNYFRVGYRLAALLQRAGRSGEATRVLDQIGLPELAARPTP